MTCQNGVSFLRSGFITLEKTTEKKTRNQTTFIRLEEHIGLGLVGEDKETSNHLPDS